MTKRERALQANGTGGYNPEILHPPVSDSTATVLAYVLGRVQVKVLSKSATARALKLQGIMRLRATRAGSGSDTSVGKHGRRKGAAPMPQQAVIDAAADELSLKMSVAHWTDEPRPPAPPTSSRRGTAARGRGLSASRETDTKRRKRNQTLAEESGGPLASEAELHLQPAPFAVGDRVLARFNKVWYPATINISKGHLHEAQPTDYYDVTFHVDGLGQRYTRSNRKHSFADLKPDPAHPQPGQPAGAGSAPRHDDASLAEGPSGDESEGDAAAFVRVGEVPKPRSVPGKYLCIAKCGSDERNSQFLFQIGTRPAEWVSSWQMVNRYSIGPHQYMAQQLLATSSHEVSCFKQRLPCGVCGPAATDSSLGESFDVGGGLGALAKYHNAAGGGAAAGR